MKITTVRVTGDSKDAVAQVLGEIVQALGSERVDAGIVRASTRQKYSGQYIAYAKVFTRNG